MINGGERTRLRSELRVAMRRDVAAIKHITKIIGETKSMVGYANDILKGVRVLTMCEYANDTLKGVEVVTAKYASA